MNNRYLCKNVYLDNAATSRFKPRKVLRAVKKELMHSANPGRGGHCDSVEAGIIMEKVRDELNAILGDGHVVLTKNCTESLNIALFGSQLKGEVITTVFEHNSVLRPLYKLSAENKIKMRFVKPASNVITAKEVSKHITKDTSMIAMSEMSNVTGAIHEIEEIGKIAKEKGITFLVDVAQSMGHTYTDYSNVDIVCGSGHKGLHSPQGTGFLYFKKHIRLAPLIYGGTGIMGLNATQPTAPPEGFESGTANTLGYAGMLEGIRFTVAKKDKIVKKINLLSEYLLEEIHKIKGITVYSDNHNGVISFNVGKVPSTDIATQLDINYHIAVRSGIHCAPLAHRHMGTLQQGAVRASLGYCNKYSHVEKLIYALRDITANLQI